MIATPQFQRSMSTPRRRLSSCFGSYRASDRRKDNAEAKMQAAWYTRSVKPFLDPTKLDRLCVGKSKAQTSSNHTVLNEVVREAWYYKY